MKFIYAICAVVLSTLISIPVYSQNPEYRTCDTDNMWLKALAKDPSLAKKAQESLDFFRKYAGPEQQVKTASGAIVYVIPTVFHVIHNYGIENINKAQILDAMDILNKSFQKLNDDTSLVIPLFQPIFADCQIEFRLATIDPMGNCTDGINRVQSTLTYSADDNVKSLIDWPSNQYLNIWVVSNISSGAAGYSYYPGIFAGDDGIVILQNYVGGIGTSNGSNYTERSLAHEVGHWLNLPHTWGSTNSPGDPANCNTDDGVFDTPNTIGTANFSCNVNQSTCGAIDNVQNYMDYAGCHLMFTNGQKARMHAALNSSIGDRDNLNTPSNLLATGTQDGAAATTCNPIADFTDRKLTICSGTTIHFKDASWGGDVTNWQWTFNGGTPANSNIQNPVIQYNVPGIYDVTLIVGNSSGNDQLTRTAFVEVLADTGTSQIPVAESFETLNLPASEWTVENPDNNNAWDITSSAASLGTKSLKLTNFSGNVSGSTDAIISPVLNFSNAASVMMTFDVAFARKNSADASNLKVAATNNCGQQWIIRYNKSGAALETAPFATSSFTPTALQWRTETVNLKSSSISTKPAVRLKFEFTNSQGNNIYIDNINITGNLTAVGELSSLTDFAVYPNPTEGDIHVSFGLENKLPVSISILDITGRIVMIRKDNYNSGNHDVIFTDKPVPGIYMISLTAGNDIITQKLIIR